MAQNQVNVRLITRNDTAQNWLEKDPILLMGELGIENDTGLLKVGDDIHPWSELDYINVPSSSGTPSVASHYEGTAELKEDGVSYETDEEVIARVLASTLAKNDDIFIVKRVISGEKVSKTAYVYNGTKWTAMDGNYNAENVYFDEDLTVTANIGAVIIPEGQSNTTIKSTGKNIKDVLASILAVRKTPTATKPTVSVKLTSSTLVEVGTEVTPVYEATLNPGSYTYGPETGITATSWTVKDNLSTPNTATTATGSFPAITVGDSTTYKITATANYSEGAIPKDNLGDDYEAEKIPAGSASATTLIALKGYRNYYYGVLTTSSKDEPLTDEIIRNLTAGEKGGYNAKKTFSMTAGEGAKRMIIAYPANTTRGGLSSVILPNSLNFDAFANGSYVQHTNIEVHGVNNYTATPYTVWVYEPTSIDPTEIHNVTLA